MSEKTIREIGGEIWSEIMERKWKKKSDVIAGISDQEIAPLIDLITGILARYEGVTLVNDDDMPVTPLPKLK